MHKNRNVAAMSRFKLDSFKKVVYSYYYDFAISSISVISRRFHWWVPPPRINTKYFVKDKCLQLLK